MTDIFITGKKYNIIYADPPWEYGSKQPFRSGGVRFHQLDKNPRDGIAGGMRCEMSDVAISDKEELKKEEHND